MTEQVRDLIGWLPGDGVPLTMLGDFNAPLDESAISLLTARSTANFPPIISASRRR